MVSLLVASLVVAAPALHQEQTIPAPAPAIVLPQDGELQQLDLKDGTRALGRVEAVDGNQFTFRTTAGVVMTVDISQVTQLGRVKGEVVDGEFWPDDSNRTRLLFAPTGRTLRRGESYLAVYEATMPFVQVGITDRISIGAGTPLMVAAFGEVPFWISPKVQVVSRGSTHAAVGVLHLLNVGEANVGIAYGVVTHGGGNSAVTAGIGYAYAHSDASGAGGPVAMIGGERRLSRRVKFVTENYVFNGAGLVSGGFRLLGERLTVDIGLVTPVGLVDEIIAAPIVNFVWKF